MRIEQFVWLETIIDKLAAKHAVTPAEAEEVLYNHPRLRFQETGHQADEDMYAAYGVTDAGRYRVVFFIYKDENAALVVSARDMDTGERRRHERKWRDSFEQHLEG